MKKPSTPFPTTGYHGPEYFCDREKETNTLLNSIKGGRSIVLIAQRRIGKTALILHTFNKLPARIRCIYLDILPTENMTGFLNELATSVIRNVSEKKGIGRKIWDFIKSLRPTISFDTLTGSPQVTFFLRGEEINRQIEAILDFLEKQDERFVIAIDEFQQILKYPEKNTDAWLRSVIQRLKNTVFIFSGSQQHLMNELFTLPSRPFYNSTGLLKIDRIAKAAYKTFISQKFHENNISIDENTLDQMMTWTDCHTYYVQLLCNRIFLSGEVEIIENVWKNEAFILISEQESVFFNYRSMLTSPQWQLLKAISLEGELYEPTGNDFTYKYMLGNPATVLRSLNALLRMELVHFDYDQTGKRYYKINDLLFRRWVESL